MNRIVGFFWTLIVIVAIGIPNCAKAEEYMSASNAETVKLFEQTIQSVYPGSYFDGRDFNIYIPLGDFSTEIMESLKNESEKDAFRENFVASFCNSADPSVLAKIKELFKTSNCSIIFVLTNTKKDVIVLTIDGRDF